MKTNLLNFKKTSNFFMKAVLCLTLIGSFTSCSDDDDTPAVVEEEEAVTSVVLTYTNQQDTTDTVVLTWVDANEDLIIDGGEQSVVGTFSTEAVYDATIGLFAEDEDFLEEDILEEQAAIDAHFFLYNTNLDFTMERAANDYLRTDGINLGVKTVWTAGTTAGTGTITAQLFHEAPSVNDDDGFGSTTGTDTDLDITFSVTVE